jgi:hypothetical protein
MASDSSCRDELDADDKAVDDEEFDGELDARRHRGARLGEVTLSFSRHATECRGERSTHLCVAIREVIPARRGDSSTATSDKDEE